MRWYKVGCKQGLTWVLLSALVLACSAPGDDEALIAAKIEQMKNAVEDKSARKFLQPVFDGFSSKQDYDKKWLQRTFAFYQLRHQRISVVITNLDIHIGQSGVAKAQFNALLVGGDGLIPDSGGVYQVETDWRQRSGQWELVYAGWSKP